MAKAIRWQIPFVSVTDKHYRIDIYDEGWTGSITTLTAGPNPFTTDEDASDDFFAPIRTQTGNIEVCTATPGGGMLTLDEILPANNIARPVRLMNTDSNSIEWQGFLSCEAYSQDYVGIPQILQLPVISVLEAMGSVECDPKELNGAQKVHTIIGNILRQMYEKSGVEYYNVVVAGMGREILHKYINTALLYEIKERNYDKHTETYTVGITIKDALSMLATYMGWVVREESSTLYIQTAGVDSTMALTSTQSLESAAWQEDEILTPSVINISDLVWRGTGHAKSVAQGARNVEVVANLEQYDISIDIPGFPKGEYQTGTTNYLKAAESEEETDETVAVPTYGSTEQGFDNRYIFKNWTYESGTLTQDATVLDVFNNSEMKTPSNYSGNHTKLGAFVGRVKDDDLNLDYTGLCIVGNTIQGQIANIEKYAVRILSYDNLSTESGSLALKLDGFGIGNYFTQLDSSGEDKFMVVVRWGNMYLQSDLTTWGASLSGPIMVGFDTEIPINIYNSGALSLYIFPCALNHYWTYMLTSASLEYVAPEGIFDERGSNTYFKPLGTAFRDEISISTDIASSLQNTPCKSIILNSDPASEYNPLTLLPFYIGTVKRIRPEEHLLGRLAMHYSLPRTSLTLEVEPLSIDLARIRLSGINDGKVYLPLAQSVDWANNICTIKCIETAGMYTGEDEPGGGGGGGGEDTFIVYANPGVVWDSSIHYIRLAQVGDITTIYITSSDGVDWIDQTGNLDGVLVGTTDNVEDYEYQSGYIPAGEMVPVHFYLEEASEEDGIIALSQNGVVLLEIEVLTR